MQKERDDLYYDVVEDRHSYQSLYTWMRANISSLVKDEELDSFTITVLREDGYNLSYSEYKDTLDVIDPKRSERHFQKVALGRVEESILAIKEAIMHERILLNVILGKGGVREFKSYLIIRFDDKEYIHPEYGPKVKQTISVFTLKEKRGNKDLPSPRYSYHHHLTISGIIKEIASNEYLKSLVFDSKINVDSYKKLLGEYGNGSDVYNKFLETKESLKRLDIAFKSLSKEEIGALKSLPLLGQPNYQVVVDEEGELDLKLYLKNSTSLSKGNGNAYSFNLKEAFKII